MINVFEVRKNGHLFIFGIVVVKARKQAQLFQVIVTLRMALTNCVMNFVNIGYYISAI